MNTLTILDGALPGWWLGMMGWTAMLLLAAFALDRALARRIDPAVRMLFYLPVFLRLLLPVVWSSPLGVVHEASTPAIMVQPAIAPLKMVVSGAPAPTPIPMWLILWCLGSVVLLGIWAARSRHLERRLRASVMGTDALQRYVGDKAVVLVHPHLGPMVYGFWHPTLVLPESLAEDEGSRNFDCAVAHELAHLSRGDLVLTTVIQLICVAAWPVVPLWLASKRVHLLIEQAADAAALRTIDHRPRDYGNALLEVGHTAPVLAHGGIPMAAYDNLRERLSAMVHPASWSRAAAVPLAVFAGIVLMACAATVASEVPPEADVPRALEAPVAPIAPRAPAVAPAAPGAHAMVIERGRSTIVLLDEQAHTIAVADPRIAGVQPVGSARRLQVLGYDEGHTQMVVEFEGGAPRLIYDIDVTEETQIAHRPQSGTLRRGEFFFITPGGTPKAISVTNPRIVEVRPTSNGDLQVVGLDEGATDVLIQYGPDEEPEIYDLIVTE